MSARARLPFGAAGMACVLALFASAALVAGAFGAERDVPVDLPVTGIPTGYTLIEGDIIVKTSELGKPNVGRYSTFQPDKVWPGGVVPFLLDTSVTNYAMRVSQIQAAMAAVSAAKWGSAITFVPRTNESDYVYYINGGGNFSPVGKQGGKQEIHVVSWNNYFVICHETMHSLGFYHEQGRSDRDTYVTIHLQNICDNCCNGGECAHNFIVESSSSNYGPYDFDSIMHYGKCDFLKPSLFCPGNETITVNAPWTGQWQDAIGQRSHLSRMDLVTLSFLYPLGNWRFVASTGGESGSGTFMDPWPRFSTGVSSTPSGGTLYVQPGNYAAPISGSISTTMRIEAPLGGVQITRPLAAAMGNRQP